MKMSNRYLKHNHVMNQQHFPLYDRYNQVILNLHYKKETTLQSIPAALLELHFFNNRLYPFASFPPRLYYIVTDLL